LTALTLGAVLPWREAALERYKMRHCYYGDLAGRFEGRGSELFKRGWKLWLMAIAPLIAAILAAIIRRIVGVSLEASIIVGILWLVWIIALPFIYGAFRAIEWRWWISGVRFGQVSFESDLSSNALYGLYWKVIGWFVLIGVLFSAYVYACAALIAGPGGMTDLAKGIQESLAMSAAIFVGYLGIILALNVVLRVYLLRDIWARAVASTTALRLETAANVVAKGDLVNALGEGLAGGLDVVGF
jgi:uncharacterized membrane protein YjgN (DUF898 family)